MSAQIEKDLIGFHNFLGERLQRGNREMTPEEALDLWRAENPLPAELADSVEALKEALADMQAGDTGQPFEDFDREFRKKNGLPIR